MPGVVGSGGEREWSGRRNENEGSRPQTPSESAKLWRLTGGKRGCEGFIDRRRLTTPARAYVQGVPVIEAIKIKDL